MAHKDAGKRKRAVLPRAASSRRRVIVNEICPECGYAARHLVRSMTCPMCAPCPRCGRKLMRCSCIEGE